MSRLNQHAINQHCLRDNSSVTRVVEQSIPLYHNHMYDDVTPIFVYKQTPLIMWWIRWGISKNTELLLCNVFHCIPYWQRFTFIIWVWVCQHVKFILIMIQPHTETLESVNPLQIQSCLVRVKGQPSCPQSCVLCKARGWGLCKPTETMGYITDAGHRRGNLLLAVLLQPLVQKPNCGQVDKRKDRL